MAHYRSAGQDFFFPYLVPDLRPFEMQHAGQGAGIFVSPFVSGNEYPAPLALSSRTTGWVGGRQCQVETWSVPEGFILKVAGGSDFFIASDGSEIVRLAQDNPSEVTGFDQAILVSPVLVLALALRGIWSLHASAVMYNEHVVVFLGESGQGKSTLAAYLAQCAGWQLVADDILPVKSDAAGVNVFPRFPQLKLPTAAQPATCLPEHLPLKYICVLAPANPGQQPEFHKLRGTQIVQALLSHIAGTRLFDAALLAKHLQFSTQVARSISAYRLIYPHRRDTLPQLREFLEKIC